MSCHLVHLLRVLLQRDWSLVGGNRVIRSRGVSTDQSVDIVAARYFTPNYHTSIEHDGKLYYALWLVSLLNVPSHAGALQKGRQEGRRSRQEECWGKGESSKGE
jgi:hypothetical protein